MTVLLWIVQGLLVALFVIAGSTKVFIFDRVSQQVASNKAFSSGVAATTTWVAPASRTTEATAAEMQHCGIANADISTPAARAASRNARALRCE